MEKKMRVTLKTIYLEKLLLWGIPLYIFLLPWQARHIFLQQEGAELILSFYSVYVTDILFFLLLVVWSIWAFIQRKTMAQRISKPLKLSLLIGFLFVGFTALSVQFATNVEIASFKWDKLLQGLFVFFMMVTVHLPIRSALVAILSAGVLQALVGIQQFFVQAIPASTVLGMAEQLPERLGASIIEFQGGRWLRAYGTLPHPNILGGFLTIAALIASGWYFGLYAKMTKYHGKFKEVSAEVKRNLGVQVAGSYIAFGVLMTGLLMTFSRTAWLGFAVGWLFLVALFTYQQQGKMKGYVLVAALKQVIFGGLLLAVLSLSYAPFWTDRVFGTNQYSQRSVVDREVYLSQAKEMITDKWLLGTGLGDYLFEVSERFAFADTYAIQPVHNTWLYLWGELGIIGLLIFFGWVFALHKLFIQSFRKKLRNDSLIVFSLLFAIGIMMYFDHFWWSTPFGLWLFMLLAMLTTFVATQNALNQRVFVFASRPALERT